MSTSNISAIDSDKLVLINTINQYGKLENNWDGYGGICPKPETIIDAKKFLDLLPVDVNLPVPMVASDGEVSFFWRTPLSYLEIGFYGNSKYLGIYNSSSPFSKEGFDAVELNQASFDFNVLPYLQEMYNITF